ncbi:hypothetical protein N9Z44_01135 [Mariniblastus sp.]|nr:hypothetical protein [Mariniblastus sp.]
MASVRKLKRPDGSHKGWQCSLQNRKTVWLGKVSKADASYICSKLTNLERTKKLNTPPSPEVADWLNSLDDKFREKLAKQGLVDHDTRITVAELFDRCIERADCKESTKRNMRNAFNTFTNLYGGKLVAELTEDDLFEYRKSLDRLTPVTRFTYFMKVRGCLSKAKDFDRELFANVKISKPKVDFTNREYIDRVEIREVIAKVDPEYGAILALAGLCGMRCPSEPEVIRWEHVNFGRGVINVPAVKTAARITPIYADATEVLKTYHDSLGNPESGLLFPALPVHSTLYNRFQSEFGRKVKNPHQRLRSSCESFLVNEAGFAITDVSRWLGHDPMTAMKFYNQSTPATLERALAVGA